MALCIGQLNPITVYRTVIISIHLFYLFIYFFGFFMGVRCSSVECHFVFLLLIHGYSFI